MGIGECYAVFRLMCVDAGGDRAQTRIISAEYVQFSKPGECDRIGEALSLTGASVCRYGKISCALLSGISCGFRI